ncbi:MAG: acetyl-CoA carboxylase biotin carboxylase subunit [Lachnospiraceae bacterium]|nr:acetyl-CoA carboxylase biotin carboxylase subunit [Lachnospiraceae bacterium]
MFKRILIANRGEIAMRVLRCCQEMGIEGVVACSTADRESLPAQMAAQSVCIGPPPADKSYLNENALLEAAKRLHCDAIHPGYGFLSENAAFAEKCEEAGIVFIGPSANIIRRMGDKQTARSLMREKGVPVVPGSAGFLDSVEHALAEAEKVGYPVLLKATAGGGGRGMRTAFDASEVEKAFSEAQAEAQAAFGNGALYLEKLILNPRHIEVQILGDKKGNIIQLGERDCSLQRRKQKMLEESPASCLDDKTRQAILKTAVKAAKAAGYYSAGTVEFVLDKDKNFYFIEMNTRIQVEHPVTEMVTGVDLVREQIRVAAGLKLSVKQSDIVINGHAIECRINAEDPTNGFRPCPGKINFLHFPGGNGVRIDSALYAGAEISPFYDSMVGKVIVHAPNRLEALRRMRRALLETVIDGIPVNTDFLYLILFDPDFIMGKVDVSFMDTHMDALLKYQKDSEKKADK